MPPSAFVMALIVRCLVQAHFLVLRGGHKGIHAAWEVPGREQANGFPAANELCAVRHPLTANVAAWSWQQWQPSRGMLVPSNNFPQACRFCW